MFNKGCAEKFCKGCLDKIPEKEREAFMQNLDRIFHSVPKEHESCCQSPFSCDNKKDK